jgi:FtsZ-binding cell division protein ZapB
MKLANPRIGSIPAASITGWCTAAGLMIRLSTLPSIRAAEPSTTTTATDSTTATPSTPEPQAADAGDADDLARKAEIMNSAEWRRAIFELGEWLSSTKIYTPEQVRRIKVDFNRRVAGMSSFELEYLLDDLEKKFKVLDTPEAQDVRAWVGQYLSAMSDERRAQELKDVPNVVTMSAGQLQMEIKTIEEKRTSLRQRQADFEQGRNLLVQRADEARRETAAASAAGLAEARASFSPYRNQGPGKTPFSDVRTGADAGIFGGMGFGFGFGMGIW